MTVTNMEEYAETGFYTRKEPSTSTILFGFLFSHFGLFLIVSLYAIAGAYAFIAIELPNEERLYEMKQAKALLVNQSANYLGQLFWYYQGTNWTHSNFTMQLRGDIKRLEKYILSAVANNNYDGTIDGWQWSWTLPKALLFTMTIMSTIGYGHICPVTDTGKLFCIFYALVGCPLLLLFLGNLGNSIADVFIWIYSRFCCRWCRSRRNEEELPPDASKKHRKLLIDDEVGKEEYMPTEHLNVPITINLVLLSLYIMLGAALFMYWEDWGAMGSSYFTFVTLSTIGYGDMVPGNAILNGTEDHMATLKMLFCILYILLGMALLSTCINLMQEQLVGKCRWLARTVGLSKPPEEDGKGEGKEDEDKKKKKKKKKKKDKKKEEEVDPESGLATNAPVAPSPLPDQNAGPSPGSKSPAVSRSPSPYPASPSPHPRSPSPSPRSSSPPPRSPSPPRSASAMSRSRSRSPVPPATIPSRPPTAPSGNSLTVPGLLDDF